MCRRYIYIVSDFEKFYRINFICRHTLYIRTCKMTDSLCISKLRISAILLGCLFGNTKGDSYSSQECCLVCFRETGTVASPTNCRNNGLGSNDHPIKNQFNTWSSDINSDPCGKLNSCLIDGSDGSPSTCPPGCYASFTTAAGSTTLTTSSNGESQSGTAADSNDGKGHCLSAGVVAGLSITMFFLGVVLMGGVVFCIFSRRRGSAVKESIAVNTITANQPVSQTQMTNPVYRASPLSLDDQDRIQPYRHYETLERKQNEYERLGTLPESEGTYHVLDQPGTATHEDHAKAGTDDVNMENHPYHILQAKDSATGSQNMSKSNTASLNNSDLEKQTGKDSTTDVVGHDYFVLER